MRTAPMSHRTEPERSSPDGAEQDGGVHAAAPGGPPPRRADHPPERTGAAEPPPRVASRLLSRAVTTRDAYAAEEDRPLGGYLVLLALYVTLAAVLAAAVRARHRDGALPGPSAPDLVLAAVATHKLARLITKDSVLSPLRAPFTRYAGAAGEGELAEEVRGSGLRKAVGELLTCPFCAGQWVATAIWGGLLLAPRATRLVAAVFTTLAASDALQLAWAKAEQLATG
jgi:predicted nucleic acid-binding protein